MILQKYDSFLGLEKGWQNLWETLPEKTPFTSYYWSFIFQKIFSEGKPLIYTLVNDQKKVLGIAPFKLLNNTLYWLSGEEVTDYQDLICKEEDKKIFWELLIKDFKIEKIPRIILRNIPEKSLSLKILKNIINLTQIVVAEEDVVPYIPLTESYNEYLYILSRKNRHELRRKVRRFERETENKWEFIKSTAKTHDRDCHDFFLLFRQDGLAKRNFLTPPMEEFFCQITAQMQKLGLLDFSILKINNNIIAQTISFINDKKLYLYNMAVNPKFYHLSPGIIINKMLIEESIQKGLKIYDFLQGNERYKYQLGAVDEKVYKISINL